MPLIEHLATWGEIAVHEVGRLTGAMVWLEVLGRAGLVEEIRCEHGETVSWALTRRGEPLLDAQPDVAARFALFQVPAYRAYLVGILAEGLALAAKADMRERLESWAGAELAALLTEINAILDTVEMPVGRLIDLGRHEIEQRCSTLPGRNMDFGSWNQVLLGRTGRPQDLFDFVLRKFAPACTLASRAGEARPAVLRKLSLNADDGFTLAGAAVQSTWNTRRTTVASGIALFDERGQPLFDNDIEPSRELPPVIQNALLEHPFYRAVVHLCISAWRSPASSMPSVELYLTTTAGVHDVSVLLGGQSLGRLAELLPPLVCIQGFAPHGLANDVVPDELLDNLLRNLIAQKILVQLDDQLELRAEFQSSLMAQRLRTVYRPGKQLQQQMLELLRDRGTAPPSSLEAR